MLMHRGGGDVAMVVHPWKLRNKKQHEEYFCVERSSFVI
jgi:hypothetical protein